MTHRLSDPALGTLKDYEVFVGFTYDDAFYPPRPYKGGPVKGTLTIGYGHTARAAGAVSPVAGLTISQAEALALLHQDIGPFENDVNRLVKVPLTQGQFDALVLWHFNTGALAKSTLLKKLNGGDYASVPAELMKWTRSGGEELAGLVKRRRAECALWREGVDSYADQPAVPASTPVDKPKAKPVTKSKEAISATVVAAGGAFQAFGALNEQAQSAATQISGAKTVYDTAGLLFSDMRFLAAVVVALLGVAIFFWRTQRLKEDAN